MKLPDDIKPELKELWMSLLELHHWCRNYTKQNHKRINPFYEDLFEWQERGLFWTEADKGITLYNSTTVLGDVKIGKNTWIGPFCLLDGGGGLEIGKNCSIATGSQLLTHDTVRWALSGGKMPYEYAQTKIGDCCFIGSHAVINKGVTIGNHCAVGAGSVVTSDVNDLTIVAGVPAQPIGHVKIDPSGSVTLIYEKNKKAALKGPEGF